MSKSKELIVILLMSLVTLILVIIGAYVPLLGELVIVLIPTWIVFISFKVDLKYVVASFVVMLGLYLIVLPSMVILPLIIAFSYLVGIPLGIGIKRGWNSLKTIGIAGLGGVVVISLLVVLLPWLIGLTYEELLDMYKQSNIEILLTLNLIPEGSLDELTREIEAMYLTYKILLPSTIVMTGVTISCINFFISRLILIEMKFKIKRLRKFKYLKLPESFILGSFLILILSFISERLGLVNGEVMYMNILYLLQTIYAIIGMAVLNFGFAKKKRGPVGVLLSVLLIVFGMSMVLAFIGMIDTVIDSRKIRKPRIKI